MGNQGHGPREGLTLEVALGLLQEDVRNLQALGISVLARQFTRKDGTPVVVLAFPGVVLAHGEGGLRLVLAHEAGTGTPGTGT